MRLGVPVMASMIIGVAAGLSAAPASAQELRFLCDANGDSAVTAEESQGCAEQRFHRARAGTDGLVEEQFAAAFPDADDLRQHFAQVDEDGDGRISRDEWMRSFGPAHAGTTAGAGSRRVGSD